MWVFIEEDRFLSGQWNLKSLVFYNSIFVYFQTFLRGVGLFLWLAKDIVPVIIHSICCEKFYITVEKAETACILLMKNRDCSSINLFLFKSLLLISVVL